MILLDSGTSTLKIFGKMKEKPSKAASEFDLN